MKFTYRNVQIDLEREEENLQDKLKQAEMKNEAVMCKQNEYEYVYQFSGNRGNIVRWLNLPKECKLLELGASTGGLTRCLTAQFQDVTAAEADVELLLQNVTKQHQNGFRAYGGSYDTLLASLEEGSFDCIIMNEMNLEFEKQKKLMPAVYRLLREQGILLYGVDNKYAPISWWREDIPLECMATGQQSLQALKTVGFGRIEEYFPVPNGTITMELYEKEYLNRHGVDAGMYQLYYNEFQLEHIKNITKEAKRDGVLSEYMTTFLYVAKKGE